MSKLVAAGRFRVIDRDSVAALASERNLKYDADFDPLKAPRSAMMAICDIAITGQIDEFSATQTASDKSGIIHKNSEVDGTAALGIKLRVISVETGEILGSAESRSELTGVLSQSSSTAGSKWDVVTKATGVTKASIPSTSSKTGASDANAALLKLVDAEIEAVAKDLSAQVVASSVGDTSNATPAPVTPKFVGIEDGLVVINKGSTAGIKSGMSFDIVRPTNSGLKDPDTGAPIIRRKKLCTLVVSVVDDTTASGKCDGATPQAGDEIRAVAK